jgi:ABC-2 type transport system ATP-binding protein
MLTEGTTRELKDRTGGAVVELTVATGQHDATLAALASLTPRRAAGSDRIVLPAPDGPSTLRHALRLFDQADVVPTDVAWGIIWGCLTIFLLSVAKAGQARKARVPTRLR